MKATGIVRRIDDLGRVVIPKEIRPLYEYMMATLLTTIIPAERFGVHNLFVIKNHSTDYIKISLQKSNNIV